MPGFDDRTVTLDAPEQLEALGNAFASRTRLAILAALVRAEKPLHINELARRVGVDASPVRGHLELLVKVGLAREVDTAARERLFETSLRNVVVTIEGINRPVAPREPLATPKNVAKLEKKLAAMQRDIDKISAKAREVNMEIQKEWHKAAAAPARTK